MNEQEKIRRLTAHFDKLKDVYYNSLVSGEKDNGKSTNLELIVKEIIIPMFPLNFDLAMKMWLYMLKKYCGHCKALNFSYLASDVTNELDLEYSYKALKKYPELRRYLYSEEQFSLDSKPIYYALGKDDIKLADELTKRMSENNKCDEPAQEHLWRLLLYMNSNWILDGYVTKDIISFTERWGEQLEDQNRRDEVALIVDSMLFSVEDNEENGEEDYEDKYEIVYDNDENEYDEESVEELEEEEEEEPDDSRDSGDRIGPEVEEFSPIFDYNGDGKVDDEDYEFYLTYSSMYGPDEDEDDDD